MKLQRLLNELQSRFSNKTDINLGNIRDLYLELEANTSGEAYIEGNTSWYGKVMNPYTIYSQKYLDFCKGEKDLHDQLRDDE